MVEITEQLINSIIQKIKSGQSLLSMYGNDKKLYFRIYHKIKKICPEVLSTKNNGIFTQKYFASKLAFISPEDLVELYVNKKLPMLETAKLLKTEPSTVLFHLRKNKIKTRKQNGKDQLNFPKYSKEILEDLYLVQKLTLKQIQEKLKYKSPSAVAYDLKKYKIPTRNYVESGILSYVKNPERLEKTRAMLIKCSSERRAGKMTDIEKKFYDWCCDKKIKTKYQYKISKCNHQYDFKIVGRKILVELDGTYWHSSVRSQKIDAWYTNVAIKSGFKVFRFSDKEIRKHGVKIFEETLNDELSKSINRTTKNIEETTSE